MCGAAKNSRHPAWRSSPSPLESTHKYTHKGEVGAAANKPNKRTATIESQRMESIFFAFFALFPAFLHLCLLPSPIRCFVLCLQRLLGSWFLAKTPPSTPCPSWLQPKLASRAVWWSFSQLCGEFANVRASTPQRERERESGRASLAQLTMHSVILGTVAPLLYSYTTPLAAEQLG